ncbi:hypothetical protein [Liberiplasma polymorphum]|uniref:hypothetical protein n=1 Tax=Liberiplasma polymorphum TaxID=3374570 RepID=UPI003771F177
MSSKLLVTIIKKGYAKKMIKAGYEVGLKEALILRGHGTVNPAMFESLMGLTYDPERDVILCIVDSDCVFNVKEAFIKTGQLTRKNTGILLEISMNHALNSLLSFRGENHE